MEIGKIPNEELQDIIFNKIKINHKEVLLGAGIGLDTSILDFKDDLFVISTDPITGSEKGIGKLSVNISCNDIATQGAIPIGILITILIPPSATKENLVEIVDDIINTCKINNVDLIGGHTEVTDSVNRFVLSSVCIGKKKNLPKEATKENDYLIMTKYAALEGSAILALDKEEELKKILNEEELNIAKELMNETSVIKEGIIGNKNNASLMHDVTEGGLLGACWEMSQASGLGLEIYEDQIPILPVSLKICQHFKIDPLRLISSGSMLIALKDKDKLLKALEKENIKASVIGQFKKKNKIILINKEKEEKEISPPESDELYRVITER